MEIEVKARPVFGKYCFVKEGIFPLVLNELSYDLDYIKLSHKDYVGCKFPSTFFIKLHLILLIDERLLKY